MAHIITDAEAQTLTRIAKSLIGPLVSQGLIQKRDMDDTVQDLLLAAVRNADKYNETSDAGFLTFAHSVMQKAAFRAVRKNNSPSAKIIANAVPIEEICGQEDTDDPPSYTSANIHLSTDNAPDSSIKRWETIVKVRLALAGLPEDLQEVCRLLMDACTIQEIACSLDISRKTVRYRMEKIRENFVRASLGPEKN